MVAIAKLRSFVEIISSNIHHVVNLTRPRISKRKYQLLDGHVYRSDGKFRKISPEESTDLNPSNYRDTVTSNDVSYNTETKTTERIPATPLKKTTPKAMFTFGKRKVTFQDEPLEQEVKSSTAPESIKSILKNKISTAVMTSKVIFEPTPMYFKETQMPSMRDIIATVDHPAPKMKVPPSRFIEKPVITPKAVPIPKVVFEPKQRVIQPAKPAKFTYTTQMADDGPKLVKVVMKMPPSRFIVKPVITPIPVMGPKIVAEPKPKNKFATIINATVSGLNCTKIVDCIGTTYF